MRLSSPAAAVLIATLACAHAPVAPPPETPAAPPAKVAEAAPQKNESPRPLASLPYSPSLDLTSMDRSVDPCVDFYAYSCNGWKKNNPIPPDQPAWSVYGKLETENLQFLWGLLEKSAEGGAARTPNEQKIGDAFAACMDTAAIEARGIHPLDADLAAVAAIQSTSELPALLGKLHRAYANNGLLFGFGSDQDWADANKIIGEPYAGGLGLPNRDYYFKDDAKSVETRKRYVEHVARMLELAGDSREAAAGEANAIMTLETALAKDSLDPVQRRDPHNIAHHATLAELQAMSPSFDWNAYLAAAGAPGLTFFNVTEPKFFAAIEPLLHSVPLPIWKAYLRWHLAHDAATSLASAIDNENFNFYRKYLRGAEEQTPRWKRCVGRIDSEMGEALGEVFVAKTFTPETKARTVKMTALIEKAMEDDLAGLDWMSAATKKQALAKLHTIANKVGYPDRWRDYSKLTIAPGDFFGNDQRANTFEWNRQLAKIGKPLDRSEWGMSAPTVNAYFNPQMNDINFPAGVLQPPLFDAKMDEAPNYGNTGSTIGHELTHGFDDEGRQFDSLGNLRDWWTAEDAAAFKARAQCVIDQYGSYPVIDDLKINSKLTLGEDVADLGGTVLAYAAWKAATQGMALADQDGFTPDQRFFIGLAQWACENNRPEQLRLQVLTNPHSPGIYRINGVVSDMPEFAKAFSCKAGQPMVRARPCRVW